MKPYQYLYGQNWHEQLTENLRREFSERANIRYRADSDFDMINACLCWSDTRQGHSVWSNRNHWLRYIRWQNSDSMVR